MNQVFQFLKITSLFRCQNVFGYVEALEDMGLEIDFDSTLAMYEEFYVKTVDETVKLGWYEHTELEDKTADTPS